MSLRCAPRELILISSWASRSICFVKNRGGMAIEFMLFSAGISGFLRLRAIGLADLRSGCSLALASSQQYDDTGNESKYYNSANSPSGDRSCVGF
jgi:hypothetical protein